MAEVELPTSMGFIGLGLMGLPMARNLASKMSPGSYMYIYDISKEAMSKLVIWAAEHKPPANIIACTNPADVASKASTILTMLPEGIRVQNVYLNPTTGILSTLRTNNPTLLIDMSTIDTTTSSLVSSTLSTTHPRCNFHDAPVSGGVLGAEKGTLTFMLGIHPHAAHHAHIHTLLSTMGSNIFACGAPTLGLVAKLSNNYCSGLIAIATSEAFRMAMASGMDPRVLKSVFETSLAQSAVNDRWNPVPGLCPEAPASRGYEGGFRVGLMRKDFGLAVEMAESKGVGLRLGGEGLAVYQEAEGDEACTGLDSRVVYRYLGGDERWKERFPDES